MPAVRTPRITTRATGSTARAHIGLVANRRGTTRNSQPSGARRPSVTRSDNEGDRTGTDPDAAMQHAADLIEQASAKAAEIGRLLSAAQNTIAGIGHQAAAAT